jgi:hypothetical protein
LLIESKELYRKKLEIMETSKGMAKRKPKKTSGTVRAVKSKKVTTIKSGPSEEDIRTKAEEIYHERIARGEHGSADDDWHKAQEFFSGSKK